MRTITCCNKFIGKCHHRPALVRLHAFSLGLVFTTQQTLACSHKHAHSSTSISGIYAWSDYTFFVATFGRVRTNGSTVFDGDNRTRRRTRRRTPVLKIYKSGARLNGIVLFHVVLMNAIANPYTCFRMRPLQQWLHKCCGIMRFDSRIIN